MKSTFLLAALFAATTASAQSSLMLPNNSAGTEMDTPPVLPATPDVLVPTTPRSKGVAREEAEQLAGPKEVENADRNRDGRPDTKEETKPEEAPAQSK